MSFGAILDSILFKPLQLIFEVIYINANKIIDNPALSIIVLSLVMNFLVLPLYKRADAMQEEEKDIEMRLRDGVAHIKKNFRGDERMMILQTYYRQNNYKPTYVLKGAVSLFLQIPFFIAAYRFLSGLKLLSGVSFGPIADLSRPDGLIVIAGLTINVLPVIMTAVNLVSCIIFTKGSPLKSKIQLYAMAIFFLVFLYTSPSGLVFYWTLNNIFSLVKTIFYKLKNPGRVLSILASAAGVALAVYGIFFYPVPTVKKLTFFIVCGVLLQLPLLYSLLKNKLSIFSSASAKTGNKKMFFAGALYLSVLTGILIPSAVIMSSAAEFVYIDNFYNPVWFIVSAFCFAFGIFVVWIGVFYWLAKPAARDVFDKAVWTLAAVTTVNYMFFGKNLGILTSTLKYENGLDFSFKAQLINAAVILAAAAVLWFIASKLKKHTIDVLVIGLVAVIGMSAFNIVKINNTVNDIKQTATTASEIPTVNLSKNGKNVVVLMLDRAMGEYVPYIFNEKPELKEQFSGFKYYSNTVSFGGFTNFGTPALLGGYEYTPAEINKRDSEPLVNKQNEALKVMPVLFDSNGFDVTMCNPVYANYKWIPDLSIYDDYPDIKSYITQGKFSDVSTKERFVEDNMRNFFCYSILKASPLCVQEVLYDKGNYNADKSMLSDEVVEYTGQTTDGIYKSTGYYGNFMEHYNAMRSLPNITEVSEEETNNFFFMACDLTHEPMMLQEPDYVPSANVDNTEYETNNKDRFTVDGRTMKMENETQMIHYQTNMAAMIQLGKWFDYMKQNEVYDNTRIILVSDHGRNLGHSEELMLEDGGDAAMYYPLLMVKDFNSEGFESSDEFMTNGDVPTIAMNGLIENPVNPFTGNKIDSSAKYTGDQYIIASSEFDIDINNGNTYNPSKWYSVRDNIWDKNNWKTVADNAVLPTGD